MEKHLYYTEEIKLGEKEIAITYNGDNSLTDPLGIDDQFTLDELEVIAKAILKFIKNIRNDKRIT